MATDAPRLKTSMPVSAIQNATGPAPARNGAHDTPEHMIWLATRIKAS
jgi:hypothetical protein